MTDNNIASNTSKVWFAKISGFEAVSNLWGLLQAEFVPPLRVSVPDYTDHINKLSKYADTIVAFVDSEIAGAISYYANDTETKKSYVSELAARQCFRGMGVGKKLMKMAMQDAQDKGMTSMGLEVRKGNDPAIRLYESLGFLRETKETDYSFYMKVDF